MSSSKYVIDSDKYIRDPWEELELAHAEIARLRTKIALAYVTLGEEETMAWRIEKANESLIKK